jgi:hypothetical protein
LKEVSYNREESPVEAKELFDTNIMRRINVKERKMSSQPKSNIGRNDFKISKQNSESTQPLSRSFASSKENSCFISV